MQVTIRHIIVLSTLSEFPESVINEKFLPRKFQSINYANVIVEKQAKFVL